MSWFTFTWQNFLFSFLALAFEGLPFVLVGSLISGAIAAFVPSKIITGILPKNGLLATLASGLLGLCFPVCECGIVPVVRRLINKGLPVSCGVTFMLASPIVNPIAMMLSAAMMLDHLGENDKAAKMRAAIAAVVADGKVRTYDMMRIPGGLKAIGQGAASTTQMTDAILAKLALVGAGTATQ